MKYVTGIHALNLESKLKTPGDWHTSALRWVNVCIKDIDKSVFKEYGIEGKKKLPNGKFMRVANHLRALLDLFDEGRNLKMLQGFYCSKRL